MTTSTQLIHSKNSNVSLRIKLEIRLRKSLKWLKFRWHSIIILKPNTRIQRVVRSPATPPGSFLNWSRVNSTRKDQLTSVSLVSWLKEVPLRLPQPCLHPQAQHTRTWWAKLACHYTLIRYQKITKMTKKKIIHTRRSSKRALHLPVHSTVI